MAYFQGLQALTLDNKGRIMVPVRHRDIFRVGEAFSLIVTLDLAGMCLWLYPLAHWKVIAQKVQALPSFDSEVMRLQRLLVGHASEVEMDNQGRLLIPPVLRDCAKLDRDVVLMGQGNRFEVWDAQVLEKQRKSWLLGGTEPNNLGHRIQEIVL